MRRTLLALAILVVAPASTQAQEASEAEPPPEYEQRIEEALAESAAGNWADARAAFREAHAAFPNARTERGIGMVSFEIRDYVDSVRHLRRALTHAVRPLTEEQRVEVEALLARSLARVAVFSLAAVPEGAELSMDGVTVAREDDGTLLLPIGEHTVVVRGAHHWQSTIPVRGGEDGPLPMSFEVPEPTPPREGPRPAPILVDEGPPPGALALTIGGGVGFLVGVAVLIAGIVDYNAVLGATSDTEWAEISGAYARTPALQGVGYGVMGVGAALTIGGAIWLASGGGGGGRVVAEASF